MRLDKNALTLARATKQLTLEQLSAQADVHVVTIRRGYEKNISPVSVGKIAAALDVPVTDIILDQEA